MKVMCIFPQGNRTIPGRNKFIPRENSIPMKEQNKIFNENSTIAPGHDGVDADVDSVAKEKVSTQVIQEVLLDFPQTEPYSRSMANSD